MYMVDLVHMLPGLPPHDGLDRVRPDLKLARQRGHRFSVSYPGSNRPDLFSRKSSPRVLFPDAVSASGHEVGAKSRAVLGVLGPVRITLSLSALSDFIGLVIKMSSASEVIWIAAGRVVANVAYDNTNHLSGRQAICYGVRCRVRSPVTPWFAWLNAAGDLAVTVLVPSARKHSTPHRVRVFEFPWQPDNKRLLVVGLGA